MSDYNAHLTQAKHNESLAQDLFNTLSYKDWIITVSFYAAIHYIEAELANLIRPIHSDSDVPINPNTGKQRCSVHQWREELVRKHFRQIFKDFRFLRTQSQIARYLCDNQGNYLRQDVQDFFSDGFASNCLNRNLNNIKAHFGIN